MTIIHAARIAAFLLLTPGMVSAMTEQPGENLRALRLNVEQRDGEIEVQLIGHSAATQKVSYLLEVTGRSTSRHRGATTLTAGATAILSTMRASAGDDWCVKLVAEEPGRAPYEVIEGTCAPDAG